MNQHDHRRPHADDGGVGWEPATATDEDWWENVEREWKTLTVGIRGRRSAD